jgi:hypothetical protein
MKKILLSAILMATLGFANQAKAQCAGADADVTIFNININSPTPGTYDWSYQWLYNKGNASIQVVLKCGGVAVAFASCYGDLKNQTPGVVSGQLILPDPNCVGVREVEIRVYSSSNCNGTYCLAGGAGIILPVEFRSFTANRSQSNVLLKWETSTEIDNSGFMVERNIGGTWQDVVFVPTQAQGGNSTSTLTYTFNDVNTTKGISQYRIRQIDLDGKYSLSNIRAVRGEGTIGKTIVFPNPSTSGNFSIVFEDANVKRDVSIFDMSGKVIKQWRNVTNNNLQVENLPSGLFSVRILAVETGEQVVEKIVVNKR